MATNTVSEAVARPVRGLGQGGAGWVVVEAIEAFNIYDFTDRQYGLAVVIVTAVVSFIQNALENKLGKGILRAVPPKEVPVVDNSDTDGLPPAPQPVQTNNGPRPEDPTDQPPQDPNYIPPDDGDDVEIDPVSEVPGDLS